MSVFTVGQRNFKFEKVQDQPHDDSTAYPGIPRETESKFSNLEPKRSSLWPRRRVPGCTPMASEEARVAQEGTV
jgi:hypothetical protein